MAKLRDLAAQVLEIAADQAEGCDFYLSDDTVLCASDLRNLAEAIRATVDPRIEITTTEEEENSR